MHLSLNHFMPLVYPVKTSESLWFSDVFSGYRERPVRWVKNTLSWKVFSKFSEACTTSFFLIVIVSFHLFRYYWDLVIMIILAINMVILPLNIAFFYDNSLPTWIVFHSISDVLFLTDIVLNFRTGYKEDKNGYRMKFILDPKLIARRLNVYFNSFMADVLII